MMFAATAFAQDAGQGGELSGTSPATVPGASYSPDRLRELIELGKKREVKPSALPNPNALPELYPCDAALQSQTWQFLSPAERMLANGFEVLDEAASPLDPPFTVNPIRDIAEQIALYYKYNGAMPNANKALVELAAPGMDTGDDLIEFVQGAILMGEASPAVENYDLLWKNPYTGAPIAYDKEAHSPGDCFIAIVNLHPQGAAAVAKYRAKLEGKPAAQTGGMGGGMMMSESSEPQKRPAEAAAAEIPADDPSNPIVVYVRIYGKTGVLTSYVFAVPREDAPAEPRQAEPQEERGGFGSGSFIGK
jgi:hypothetical protein